jgi:hypothetical protein
MKTKNFIIYDRINERHTFTEDANTEVTLEYSPSVDILDVIINCVRIKTFFKPIRYDIETVG